VLGHANNRASYKPLSSQEWTMITEIAQIDVKPGTVEDHNVGFRGSADFQEWRKLVGHCFASPPDVEHVQQVVHGF
jgi:hypothetical protein